MGMMFSNYLSLSSLLLGVESIAVSMEYVSLAFATHPAPLEKYAAELDARLWKDLGI
jgi:hypothetical protein